MNIKNRITRSLLVIGALGIVTVSFVLTRCAPEQRQRPNIIFIMTDDHAYQAISAYGSNRNRTPNIDRLATEGIRFDRCYVTNSICAPSRAVILTGKHSHMNGVHDNHSRAFDGFQDTFPKRLQKGGYQTALVGKWHLKSTPSGFDYHEVLPGQGAYYNPDFLRNGEMIRYYGYNTDVTTDIALRWLKEDRKKYQPFMLMLHYKGPHRQFTPNVTHAHRYKNDHIAEPGNLHDNYENRASPARDQEQSILNHMGVEDVKISIPEPQRMKFHQRSVLKHAYEPKKAAEESAKLAGEELVSWRYQRFIKDYIRSVDSIDENIGLILDYLHEAGLEKNTVVVYTSDQGLFLGEHGWFDKRFMYEESIRTPLVVRWPEVIEPGQVNDEHLTSNLDFAQTFLDIAGLEATGDMQGRSLLPLLRGDSPDSWRESVYYHYYEHGFHGVPRHEGVSTGEHKLINYYTLGEWELFDLKTDPNEMTSVYDDPSYAEVQERLTAELAKLRTQYQVPPNDKRADK